MALPQWRDVGVNFSGSSQSMANAQRGIGNVIDAGANMVNTALKQQEAEQMARYRDQQMAQQQAELGMKTAQFDKLNKQDVAASEYAKNLGSVMSGGVVSAGDQAKLAAISQDQSLTPEQRAAKIDSVLPAMTKAFEKSPEAQLQLLRDASRPENLSATTGLALLREAEQPAEKQQAIAAAHAAKIEEAKIRAAENLANKQFQYGMQKAIADSANATRLKIAEMQQGKHVLPSTTALAEVAALEANYADDKEAMAEINRTKSVLNKNPNAPIEAVTIGMKNLRDSLEIKTKAKTEEEKKTKEEIGTTSGLLRTAVGEGLDLSWKSKGLNDEDARILKSKYEKDPDALVRDLYKIGAGKEVKAILSNKELGSDNWTYWGTDKEELLNQIIQEKAPQLLGKKPSLSK